MEHHNQRALARFSPSRANLSHVLERQNQGDDMTTEMIYAGAVIKWVNALNALPTQI